MTLSNLSEVRKKAWETRKAKYGNKGYQGTYAKPGWNEALELAASRIAALTPEGFDLNTATPHQEGCYRGIEYALMEINALRK